VAKSRSRAYKSRNVIDMEKAREERREKRALATMKRVEKETPAEAAVSTRRTAKRNRRRLVYLVVFIVIAILIVTTAFNIITLKMEQAKARDELLQLNEMKARLQEEISHIDSEEYIEQQARQQLKMIFPGETLYILSQPTEDTEE